MGKHETNQCLAEDAVKMTLLRATERKLRGERKLMHDMLTEAGIRSDVLADGERTCLPGRLAVALARLPKVEPPAPPTRYILHPGFVISRNDRDRHYIGVGQLKTLYGIRETDRYIVHDDSQPSWARAGYRTLPEDVHLYPSPSGNYDLPNR